MMTQSNDSLSFGNVYTSYIHYDDSPEGKSRPVLLFKNQENDNLTVFKISSKVEKPYNKKFGYEIKDWKEAGLKKPSVIVLHPRNILEIKKSDLKSTIGEITDRDKMGMLEKFIHIERSLIKEQDENHDKNKGLER